MKRCCITFGLGMLVLSLFAQDPADSLLTKEQIWFAVLVLIGLFSSSFLNFIDNSFLVHPKIRKERDSMVDSADQDGA